MATNPELTIKLDPEAIKVFARLSDAMDALASAIKDATTEPEPRERMTPYEAVKTMLAWQGRTIEDIRGKPTPPIGAFQPKP